MTESKAPLSFVLVDDDPHMLIFLQHTFKSVGIPAAVNRLKNGEELIRFLEEYKKVSSPKVDCVLVDLNMPRKNGWETLAEIKSKGLGFGLPIIVLSHSRQNDVDSLVRLGATTFLEKPVGLEEYKIFVRKIASYAGASGGSSANLPAL